MMVELIELILWIELAIQNKFRFTTPGKEMFSFFVEFLQ